MGGRGGGHHFKTMHAQLLRNDLYIAFVHGVRSKRDREPRWQLVRQKERARAWVARPGRALSAAAHTPLRDGLRRVDSCRATGQVASLCALCRCCRGLRSTDTAAVWEELLRRELGIWPAGRALIPGGGSARDAYARLHGRDAQVFEAELLSRRVKQAPAVAAQPWLGLGLGLGYS